MYVLFSSILLTTLQTFSLEVTLIHDPGWISGGAYGPKSWVAFNSRSDRILRQDAGVKQSRRYRQSIQHKNCFQFEISL